MQYIYIRFVRFNGKLVFSSRKTPKLIMIMRQCHIYNSKILQLTSKTSIIHKIDLVFQ